MLQNKNARGHIGAILCIIIWGSTFVSTKVLLRSFTPLEILVIRTVIGALALFLAKPKRFKLTSKKHALYIFGAGASGVAVYYLLENIALTYTNASNVGVIVSVAPLFTALLTRLIYRNEKLHISFFAGFVVALVGICLISFAGSGVSLNPAGDILSLIAAFTWAIYSMFMRKISTFGYDNTLVTRQIFVCGLVVLLPFALLLGFAPQPQAFANPVNLANLIYLGLGASALCFALWNYAMKTLGSLKASAYIYAVPIVTVLFSAAILGEKITWNMALGVVLTLAGLVLSELPGNLRIKKGGA